MFLFITLLVSFPPLLRRNIMILVSFSSSADVHTTGEGAALELLAAMRFLIVAIVIMKQR